MRPYEDPLTVDFVVLNRAGLFDQALPFLEQHSWVHFWLDRDVTGLAYRDFSLSLGSRLRDESGLYEKFKDLHEWLRLQGRSQKLVIRLGGGLQYRLGFGVFGLSADGRKIARFAIGKMYNCLTTIDFVVPSEVGYDTRSVILKPCKLWGG